ncbi:hypothetical protein GuthCp050 (chloroplast) [Guillardia theta]|uniref:Uncharacterized 6.1 kDa protein n=3 Tax=Guillardia theta TaxID=55529 RepID=YCX4_GUITH|nr:hypothetical protein GuthCp050 [Guillardia theta]O78452.1 RecName: Full=Uncharacterized 6.1 kDa protein; AltName: Full=ORF53 [Guillardia theta]AAC35643.1 unknown [Guillardia theta]
MLYYVGADLDSTYKFACFIMKQVKFNDLVKNIKVQINASNIVSFSSKRLVSFA